MAHMNENYVTLTIGKQKNIALIAHDNKKAELIAYEDLGAEALRRLEVEDMPLFVIIDDYRPDRTSGSWI